MFEEKRRALAALAECPACESRIEIGRKLRIGQITTCPACRERLEVVRLNPIVLDWMSEDNDDSEDWDGDRRR